MRKLFILLLLFAPFISISQKVVVIKVEGSINPASAAFIKNGIQKAVEEDAQALVVQLNTPGGLLKSSLVIVSDILSSPVPVIVYVAPGGAHAGSAGLFVTMAGHIAAMAPSTNIGAAHPVSMQGNNDSILNSKATNDAAAFIRAIADKRKRNFQWAEAAVRYSVSITDDEALEAKVIDIVSSNISSLLDSVHGRQVEVDGRLVQLKTAGAQLVQVEMSFIEELLDFISDPDVAYILMMLGFYGILFELYSPGTMVPGIIGVICLILAFYSMHTLPLNYAALALIVFSIVLFILEVKITSHGLLAVGGVIALVLGSMMLIKTSSGLEFVRISTSVIISTSVVSALFFVFLVTMAVRGQRLKPTTGVQGLIGKQGKAVAPLQPNGTVVVQGETWNAKALEGSIDQSSTVEVIAVDKLTLIVKPVNNVSS